MATVTEALAVAMEIESQEDRARLARWLQRATRAELWLDANSVRASSEETLREIFESRPA